MVLLQAGWCISHRMYPDMKMKGKQSANGAGRIKSTTYHLVEILCSIPLAEAHHINICKERLQVFQYIYEFAASSAEIHVHATWNSFHLTRSVWSFFHDDVR